MLSILLLASALLRGPDPEFFTPRPEPILIARDTVWFRAREWPTNTPLSSCYVISTRTWCALSRTEFATVRRPALSARMAQLVKLAKRPGDADASAWVMNRGTLWAAFPGISSEGDERRGALAAIDTATRKVIRYRHESIDYATVTSMVAMGNSVWLGTVREGEYGTYGGSGLVRVDPAGTTVRFAPDQQRSIAARANEVWQVGAADGIVAIMTHAGPAVRLPDGRWDAQYWVLGLQGDQIGHQLAATPVGNEDWMLLLGITNLRLTRPAVVARAFKQRQWTIDNPDWLPTDSVAQLLIRAGTTAIVKETLARPDSASSIAIAAAGYSRDLTLVPILKRRLAAPIVGEAEETALALVRLGDAAGVAWFRKQLTESQTELFPSSNLRESIARSRRPEFVTLIVSFFDRGIMPEGAMIVQDGRPVALPYSSAAEMLRILDEMDSAESRNAAVAIRRKFPQLAR
jgi:hypothetical protein